MAFKYEDRIIYTGEKELSDREKERLYMLANYIYYESGGGELNSPTAPLVDFDTLIETLNSLKKEEPKSHRAIKLYLAKNSAEITTTRSNIDIKLDEVGGIYYVKMLLLSYDFWKSLVFDYKRVGKDTFEKIPLEEVPILALRYHPFFGGKICMNVTDFIRVLYSPDSNIRNQTKRMADNILKRYLDLRVNNFKKIEQMQGIQITTRVPNSQIEQEIALQKLAQAYNLSDSDMGVVKSVINGLSSKKEEK